jgi:hypothetical protein
MVLQALILALTLQAVPAAAGRDTKEAAITEFKDRVDRYWDLHKRVEKEAPRIDKKKEDPADLIDHENVLAAIIRAERADVKEGDIFTPAARKVLAASIRQQLASGKGAVAREIILGEGNPRDKESPANVELKVNARYPSKAPLSTVPPSVLLALPKLPEGLQYRFVGRHLILFDSKANLIVDILRNAIT